MPGHVLGLCVLLLTDVLPTLSHPPSLPVPLSLPVSCIYCLPFFLSMYHHICLCICVCVHICLLRVICLCERYKVCVCVCVIRFGLCVCFLRGDGGSFLACDRTIRLANA